MQNLILAVCLILLIAYIFYIFYYKNEEKDKVIVMPSPIQKNNGLSPQEAYVQSLLYGI